MAVLKTHFPDAELFDDVQQCGAHNLKRVDCITAGVPCQDVSVAGKRGGLQGERTGLFYEFARILQELRPAWFVFENVPGLFSSNKGRDFAEILRVLMVECGYGVCWRVLDSQFFGVAQRRRRVFIVGRFGKPCPPEVLFESQGRAGDSPKGRKAGANIADTLGASADREGGHPPAVAGFNLGAGATAGSIGYEEEISPTLRGADGGNRAGVVATMRSEGDAHTGFQDEQGIVCAPTDPDRMRDFAGLPLGLDSARYRALGNAVTVQVAQWIGERILAVCATTA